MTYIDKLNHVLADPSASHWLKNALRALENRDCIDALNDVHALHELATERWGETVTANVIIQKENAGANA